METTTSQIAEYLQRFRKGDRDGAFCGLLEMEHGVLPELMAVFRSEREGIARVRLIDGTIHTAEVHWYEAHGIGRKELKIKFPLLD